MKFHCKIHSNMFQKTIIINCKGYWNIVFCRVWFSIFP